MYRQCRLSVSLLQHRRDSRHGVLKMDNLISRQAAIEAINLWLYCDKDERMPAEVIKALPPVQPKRGKWLPDNRCGGGYWVCSSCKYPTEAFAADVIYKYCPFCGADMRGETDAETH